MTFTRLMIASLDQSGNQYYPMIQILIKKVLTMAKMFCLNVFTTEKYREWTPKWTHT